MRISDEDRERAVAELRRHCKAGRIDIDAYAERVAEALGAETLADLDHALRDLPTVRIAEPRDRPPLFAPEQLAAREPGAGEHTSDAAWPARLVLLVSVLVLAVGAVFVVVAHWVWAFILVAAWSLGVLQGRVRPRRG